jgi:protein SCO1
MRVPLSAERRHLTAQSLENRNGSMTPRIGLVAVLGALAGMTVAFLVTGLQGNRATPPTPSTTGKALIGGPFQLVDTQGKPVSSADDPDKYKLVYFGFTNCPDICPAGLQQISTALDKLGAEAKAIKVLFITLDPERDTSEKLGVYLKSFHGGITGLTGTPVAIAGAAKAYRVYYKKVENGATPADYSIDHSGFMYLMNRDGNYVAHFQHNVAADKLAADILSAIKPKP